MAGVTVAKQQIALATKGAWRGDKISSGILGLGLPPLTGAYNQKTGRAEEYDPLVTTMIKDGVPPIFALGLDRDETKSFLSLGGMPDVKTGPFVSTPIMKVSTPPRPSPEDPARLTRTNQASTGIYARYMIQADGFLLNTTAGKQVTLAKPPQLLVDSGTTLNMLPTRT